MESSHCPIGTRSKEAQWCPSLSSKRQSTLSDKLKQYYTKYEENTIESYNFCNGNTKGHNIHVTFHGFQILHMGIFKKILSEGLEAEENAAMALLKNRA